LQWARRIADLDGYSNCPGPFQRLRLLGEDVRLETKWSNEAGPSQSEASE
jgi:hypothetical protein